MNNDIMISIIIPIYNAEKYLREQLESIKRQTVNNYEVIMINDGSTDNSEKIIMEYVNKNTNWNYYLKKNTGVSDTRNLGIELACGKYICFVDADDCLNEKYLECLLKQMEYDNCQLACCGMKKIKGNSIMIDEIHIQGKECVFYNKNKYEILFNKIGGYIGNKLFLREIIISKKIRFNKNIGMCEDMLFIFMYLKYIDKVKYNDEQNYYYRILESSASKEINNVKWFSIYEVYNYILENNELYSNSLLNEIIYRYAIYLYIGKYKIKHNKNARKYENFIINKFKELKVIKKEYTLKQKIKLFFYKNFNSLTCYLQMKRQNKA